MKLLHHQHRSLRIGVVLLFVAALWGMALTVLQSPVVLGASALSPTQAEAGEVLYVSSNGDCGAQSPCYTTIQAAVDAAADGALVKIAAGTYTGVQSHELPGGSEVSQIIFIDKSLTLQGGYTSSNWNTPNPGANATILDAQGKGRVIYIYGNYDDIDAIAVAITGLEITGGQAESGGGIYAIWATVTLSDNRIIGNTAVGSEPAHWMTFIGIGGGAFFSSCKVELLNNQIMNNYAQTDGGGIYGYGALEDSTAKLVGNTISNNESGADALHGGGGVLLMGHSDPEAMQLINNEIHHNHTATNGGGLHIRGSVYLKGNHITHNTAGQGGGIYRVGVPFSHPSSDENHLIMEANVIADNESLTDGGGLIGYAFRVQLERNVFSGNKALDGAALVMKVSLPSYADPEVERGILRGNLIMQNQGNAVKIMGDARIVSFNDVIMDNVGHGLVLQYAGHIQLVHTTIARNQSDVGIYILPEKAWLQEEGIRDFINHVELNNVLLAGQDTGVWLSTASEENYAVNVPVIDIDGVFWSGVTTPVRNEFPGAIIVDIQNEYTGAANFQADGYHLKSSSGARDIGQDAGLDVDIDGDQRPVDRGFDMGADEYLGVGLQVILDGRSRLNRGQTYSYSLSVDSVGMDPAQGVLLTGTLDSHLRPVTLTLSQGTCAPLQGQWGETFSCELGEIGFYDLVTGTLFFETPVDMPLGTLLTTTVRASVPGRAQDTEVLNAHTQDCYVRLDNAPTIYHTVQEAVDVADTGDKILLAGYCWGNEDRDGHRQQVYVDKSLTLVGGYTVTNWLQPDAVANPTTLDAAGLGRVVSIMGPELESEPSMDDITVDVTLQNLRITGGYAQSDYLVDRYNYLSCSGVYAQNVIFNLLDSEVYGNLTEGMGGGVCVESGLGTLRGNTIRDNESHRFGGGVSAVVAEVLLENNAIVNNRVVDTGLSNGGGGLYIQNSRVTLQQNVITGNISTLGGGLAFMGCAAITLTENTIASNQAYSYTGGGINVWGWSSTLLNLVDNVIMDNYALSGGGGMYVRTMGDGVLTGNTIANNRTEDTEQCIGGGLSILGGGLLTFSHNTVAGNYAALSGGGALFSYVQTLVSEQNVIERNQAGGDGGGLLVTGGRLLSERDLIRQNSASSGGGIELYCNHAVLTNTVLISNTAKRAGSALYVGGSTAQLLHPTINGGATAPEIVAGVCVTPSFWYEDEEFWYGSVTLQNALLLNHSVGIAVAEGNTATLDHVLVHNNTEDFAGTGSISATHVITGEPALAADGYHLTLASVALDAGVDIGVTEDIDGDPRPHGLAPDLGADEVHTQVTIIIPGVDTTLSYTDTQGVSTTVEVPAGALTGVTTLVQNFIGTVVPPEGKTQVGEALELAGYQGGSIVLDAQLTQPVTMTMQYNTAALGTVTTDTLYLAWWEGDAWVPAETTCQNGTTYYVGHTQHYTTSQRIVAPICRLGRFVLFGTVPTPIPTPPLFTHTVYIPVVMRME